MHHTNLVQFEINQMFGPEAIYACDDYSDFHILFFNGGE